MSIQFEWDQYKAASNLNKHAVSFEEAASVFRDPFALIFEDETHSFSELREIIMGHSTTGRLLLVAFTQRGDRIRIISARRATRQERKDYEDNATF